jgi:glycosyltransferase involved in cell wall biosynthesis
VPTSTALSTRAPGAAAEDSLDVAPSPAPRPPDVSVVLPCLDEAASVGRCIADALAAFRDGGYQGEVVVVDNGSTDGSADIARRAGARVVTERTRGYGSALLAGFRAARGEIVVMADADSTYDLRQMADLVEPVRTRRADLVLGSRLEAADSGGTMPALHRRLGVPVLSVLISRLGGAALSDSQSGYRAFRRRDIDRLSLRATGMELASEMLLRAGRQGWSVAEVPVRYRERVGTSKLATMPDGLRHLRLIVRMALGLAPAGAR